MSDNANTSGTGGQGNAEGNNQGSGNSGTGVSGSGEKTLTLTQTELNALMAKNRRELTAQNQQLLSEIEGLKTKTSMTADEKNELETRLEQMRQQFMTADERKTREAEKKQRELSGALEDEKNQSKKWATLYKTHKIANDLTAAAITGEAVNPEQVITLLGTAATLQDILDADGKPTGDYMTVVNYATKDPNTGKSTVLTLSPADAVARMKEEVQRYGNLFKPTLRSGFGGNNSGASGSGKPSTEALKDTETYMRWRKEQNKTKR